MSFFDLFTGLIFGIIGMAAIGYGKKTDNWHAMLAGAILLVVPYFVSTLLAWCILALLIASFFVFKEQ